MDDSFAQQQVCTYENREDALFFTSRESFSMKRGVPSEYHLSDGFRLTSKTYRDDGSCTLIVYTGGLITYKVELLCNIKNGSYYKIKGGVVKTGTYKNGKKEGKFVVGSLDGKNVCETEYRRGAKDGLCSEKFGKIHGRGSFSDGKKNGKWIVEVDDLVVYECFFEEDVKSGEYKKVKGETFKKGFYKDGKKTGLWQRTEGKKVHRGQYRKGKKVGKWCVFSGSKLEMELEYSRGELNGNVVTFFSSGKIKSVLPYTMGLTHGEYLEYHSNGKIKKTGTFILGKKDRVWRERDRQGNFLSCHTYEDGIETAEYTIDENGNLVFSY